MGWAHAGYACAKCKGHIHVTVESTGRMSPPFGYEVMDGHHLKGKLLCNKCYEEEKARLEKEIRAKYPKEMTEEQKHSFIREIFNLIMG